MRNIIWFRYVLLTSISICLISEDCFKDRSFISWKSNQCRVYEFQGTEIEKMTNLIFFRRNWFSFLQKVIFAMHCKKEIRKTKFVGKKATWQTKQPNFSNYAFIFNKVLNKFVIPESSNKLEVNLKQSIFRLNIQFTKWTS